MTEIRQRVGNGCRYVMQLGGPGTGRISILRGEGDAELIAVPYLDDDGSPALSGKNPTIEDLEVLVDLHIRCAAAVLQLARTGALNKLGQAADIAYLEDRSFFLALRVAGKADEAGQLAALLGN